MGEVSYRLKLPERTLIHPVVHVSLLRQAPAPQDAEQVRLPPNPAEEDQVGVKDEPHRVLQRRQYQRGSTVRTQAPVQWTSLPTSLATWEDEAQLQARFPHAAAWGQAATEERGNVTPATSPTTTEPDEEGPPATQLAPGRPVRQRKPSRLLDPKDWVLK